MHKNNTTKPIHYKIGSSLSNFHEDFHFLQTNKIIVVFISTLYGFYMTIHHYFPTDIIYSSQIKNNTVQFICLKQLTFFLLACWMQQVHWFSNNNKRVSLLGYLLWMEILSALVSVTFMYVLRKKSNSSCFF